MDKKWCYTAVVSLVGIILSPTTLAIPQSGPPAEARTACMGVTQERCSFKTPRGELTGICRQTPHGMACVPAQRTPSHRAASKNTNIKNASPMHPNRSMTQPLPNAALENKIPLKVKSRLPDTGQRYCFDNQKVIPCPSPSATFFGQDAQYLGAITQLKNNHDGTISDENTHLMWQRTHNQTRVGYNDAKNTCESLKLAGHDDWRLPSIKELFSIADFSGSQHSGRFYLNTHYFEMALPNQSILKDDPFSSHRIQMMGQTWSSTLYSGKHWGRDQEAAFFFNFFDGHIKQAPTKGRNTLFYRCVRGDDFGNNQFERQKDGTILDKAIGLRWQVRDDGHKRNWQQALNYCLTLNMAGHQDWRLPNIKELQSIVDYRYYAPALDPRYLQQSDAKGWLWS